MIILIMESEIRKAPVTAPGSAVQGYGQIGGTFLDKEGPLDSLGGCVFRRTVHLRE